MYRLRGCPRCSGDEYRDGDEWACFLCGCRVPVKPVVRLPLVPATSWRRKGRGIDTSRHAVLG